MKRVALHTLGCKLNFAETSTIGRQFVERGFHVVDFHEPAEVYVLNTCSVTGRADREARQVIRRALRTSPDAYVIVVGCYAQLEPEEIARVDGVDLILGSSEKLRLFDFIDDFTKNSYPQMHVSDIHNCVDFGPAFSADTGYRTRGFLKIQDGCDFTCSFCTIPLARGASRSQPIEVVLQQATFLARQGFKEIVLTGVNVGDYGKNNGTNLLALLKELENVTGIERVRISSIEANLLTREMVDFIIHSERICNHFHIPMQSGSNSILKKMRRRYLANHYRELTEYVASKDPDAGIGADVIVGFPGETDALFEETYMFLVDLPISYFHVFTYSERPNTPAAQFPEAVEPKVRSRRSEMLRNLGWKKRHDFYSRFVGKTTNVLFENTTQHSDVSGLTTNYIRVKTRADGDLVNRIIPVTIRGIDDDECVGVIEHDSLHGYSPGDTLLAETTSSAMAGR